MPNIKAKKLNLRLPCLLLDCLSLQLFASNNGCKNGYNYQRHDNQQ